MKKYKRTVPVQIARPVGHNSKDLIAEHDELVRAEFVSRICECLRPYRHGKTFVLEIIKKALDSYEVN